MAFKRRGKNASSDKIRELDSKVRKIERGYGELRKENVEIKEFLFLIVAVFILFAIMFLFSVKFNAFVTSEFNSGSYSNVVSETSFSHISVGSSVPYGGVEGSGTCTGSLTCGQPDSDSCSSAGCTWGGASPGSCVDSTGLDCASMPDESTCNSYSSGCTPGYGAGSCTDSGYCNQWNGDNAACEGSGGCGYDYGNGQCRADYCGDGGYQNSGSCGGASPYCSWTNGPFTGCSNAGACSSFSDSNCPTSYGCSAIPPVSNSCYDGGSQPSNACSSWNGQEGNCKLYNNHNTQCTWNVGGSLGLVAYYSFDGDNIGNAAVQAETGATGGTAYDYSSNSIDGTYNGVAGTTSVGCKSEYGQCGYFSSSDVGSISAPAVELGANPFTISLWVKPSALTENNQRIMGFSADNFLIWVNAVGQFQIHYIDTVKSWSPVSAASTDWTLLTFTKDASGNLAFYKNGASVDSSTGGTGTVGIAGGGTYIGGWGIDIERFGGLIDDVMIFNHALSSDQVAAIYGASSSRFAASSGTHSFSIDLGTNTTANITLGDYVIPSGTSISAQISTGTADGAVTAFTNGFISDYALPSGDLTSATLKIIYNADGSNFFSPVAGVNVSVDGWGEATPADTILPVITVISPTATTYGSTSVLINFTASDDIALGSLWFFNGTANISYSTPLTLTLADGDYTFIFYANDSSNNINSSSVTFSVSTSLVCGSLSSANTVYTLTQNVNSSGTCFTIAAENVTLNCNGFVINYSQSSGGYAVDSEGYNFTTIKNCIMTQGSTIPSSHGIYVLGGNNASITNNTISIYSNSTNGIYLDTLSSNNYVYGNNISVLGGTTSTTGGTGIVINGSGSGNIVDSNILLVNFPSTYGTAFGIYNRALLNTISNNNVTHLASGGTIVSSTTSSNYTRFENNFFNATSSTNTILKFDSYSSYNNITSNTIISGNGSSALWFSSHNVGNIISNNNISSLNRGGSPVVYFSSGSSTNTLSSNLIISYPNSATAVYMTSNSTNNIVSTNSISVYGNSSHGIKIDTGSTNNNFTSNNIYVYGGNSSSTSHGIMIYSNSTQIVANNVTTTGVTTHSNTGVGIYMFAGSDYGVVDSNNVNTSAAGAAAVFINNASNINVSYNNLITTGINNSEGVKIQIGNNNLILGNAISTTGGQARGVNIGSDASNNVVTNNTASQLGGDGIFIKLDSSGVPANNNYTNNVFNSVSGYYLFFFNASVGNGSYFIDQYISNYSFDGPGSRVHFKNSRYGSIEFLSAINGSGTNLSADIKIGNNSVLINSSANAGLNRSANISLYGLSTSFANPLILKDGVNCSDCSNFTSLNAGTVKLGISGGGSYSIGEYVVPSLPSCLLQCTEGQACTITSACQLNSSMCSGDLCQFTNLTLSAQLSTGQNASGVGGDLNLNITSTSEMSPVIFLSGGLINFSGANGAAGGDAGNVNITVYNLFNTTRAYFYGIGGNSSTSARGGNGGKINIMAHGVIRWFDDHRHSMPINVPVLTRGTSNGGTAGTTGTKTFNKDLSCTSLRFRDTDISGDGVIDTNDLLIDNSNYNSVAGEGEYVEAYDISCDDKLNVIELSRIGLGFNAR